MRSVPCRAYRIQGHEPARQGGGRGHRRRRGIDPADINNVWKALARHPAVMEQFAAEMKAAFAPGKLDPLTKELVYLAVSIANQCDYCIASHGTMARARA